MKKIKYILVLLIFTSIAYGQSACDNHPYGISTNPDSPANPHSPNMTNDFFDWRIPDWVDYFDPGFIAPYPGSLPSTNPYRSIKDYLGYLSGYDENGNFNENEIDYAENEGWELIARGFGKTMDGAIYPEFYQPYVLMYNKYLSRLRFLFSFPRGSIVSSIQIMEVTLTIENGKSRGIFAGQDGLAQPMDQPTAYTELTGIANFVQNGWSHVEFDVEYDPCTCMAEEATSIEVSFKAVLGGSINMTGMFVGENQSLLVFNSINGMNDDELLTVLGGGENPTVGTEIYKSIDAWIDKVQSTPPPPNSNIDSIVGFIGGMLPYFDFAQNHGLFKIFNDNTDFSDGVKAMAKITKSANTVLKKFASPDKKPSFPSVIQEEIALSGTVNAISEDEVARFSIYNPGSAPPLGDVGNEFVGPMYPVYNEVLGRFALLKTPIVHFVKGNDTDFTKGKAWKSFQLDESSIEYVFNPAANVDVANTEILAALVVNTEYLEEPIAETVNLEYLYVDSGQTKRVYISPFLPLQCLGNAGVTYEYQVDPGDLVNYTDIMDTVFLRLIIKYQFNELNRNGQPNQALQILTYPVVLAQDPNLAPNSPPYSDGFSNVLEGNATLNGAISSDVYSFGTITITGPIINTTGSPIKIVAQQIIVAGGVVVPDNFELVFGLPPQCGDPIGTSTIDLAAYCRAGAYQANIHVPPTNQSDEEKNQKESRVSVFPNPFRNKFTVEYHLEKDEDVVLLVRNELGVTIFSKTFDDNIKGQHFYQIDGSQLPTGIYFLSIQTESDLETVKLMKQAE